MKIIIICIALFLVSGTFVALAASMRPARPAGHFHVVAMQQGGAIAPLPRPIRVILAAPF